MLVEISVFGLFPARSIAMCLCEKELLPEAMLETTEDKDHCLVIKTREKKDSFVLLGSSEPVVSRRYTDEKNADGNLECIAVGVPPPNEKGIAIFLVRHVFLDMFCGSCGEVQTKTRLVFVLFHIGENGSPRASLRKSIDLPSGCALSGSNGYLEISAFGELYTARERGSRTPQTPKERYVPSQKLARFLIYPSLDFLKEAATCAHFQHLFHETDEKLKIAVHDMLEAKKVEKASLIKSAALGREFGEEKKKRQYVERELARTQKDLQLLEEDFTSSCTEFDTQYDALDAVKEAVIKEKTHLEETLEDLRFASKEMHRKEQLLIQKLQEVEKVITSRKKGDPRDSLRGILEDVSDLLN